MRPGGLPNAVALMGRTLSDQQALLLSRFPSITLLLDGDEPGTKANHEVGAKLLTLPVESVRVVFLPPPNRQPDTLSPASLADVLH